MAREEMRYRGPLDFGDGHVRHVEVWGVDSTLVAFEGGQQVAVMQQADVRHTDDRRIHFTGAIEGEPGEWLGPDPERIVLQFGQATLHWPDGSKWAAAQVSETQYGVLATAAGQDHRFLPGARVEMVGTQRWIVQGAQRILAEVGRRGCGSCGG